jgi:hypothetical protein
MPSKMSAKSKKMIAEKAEREAASKKEVRRHRQVRTDSRTGETTSQFTKGGTPVSKKK